MSAALKNGFHLGSLGPRMAEFFKGGEVRGGKEADGAGAEVNRAWGKIGKKSRERALPGAVWEESALGGQKVQSGGGTNPTGLCRAVSDILGCGASQWQLTEEAFFLRFGEAYAGWISSVLYRFF